ncbi:MAG: peptidylprolyl isomerase [Halothiobacillaceae bacterium]
MTDPAFRQRRALGRHLLGCLAGLTLLVAGGTALAEADPRVALETTEGRIVIALDPERAPATVENFLEYVDDGHYDGTLFHRVIAGFMIQGGGFTETFEQKPTRAPVKNEADNGLDNDRGTIAMARTMDPQSATAQFFINVVDNDFLNFTAPTPRGYGYTVFGRVIEGMDVVDRIATRATGPGGPFPSDVPREAVLIESAEKLATTADE